jgi:hypothetical protein
MLNNVKINMLKFKMSTPDETLSAESPDYRMPTWNIENYLDGKSSVSHVTKTACAKQSGEK